MQLHEILDYAPIVVAVIVFFNVILAGVYDTFSRLYTKAQDPKYVLNKYIQSAGRLSLIVLKFLEIFGFSPVRPAPKQEKPSQEADFVSILLGITQTALNIWESKEKTKYQDRLISLKKDWYEEYNKPENERSGLTLDRTRLELLILTSSISSAINARE